MQRRGHSTEQWQPTPLFYRLPVPSGLKKWMGYIDQYIVFPAQVRKKLRKINDQSIFIFTDHALGPWVGLVKDRKHVIHCHDFLAQESAMGKYKENPTGFTGRIYQSFIRRGFTKGRNFISISQRTKQDLSAFLPHTPEISEIVYNGITREFREFGDRTELRKQLAEETGIGLQHGYILHVGGNQWYKNRTGVIKIYDKWRALSTLKLPLLLVGNPPAREIQEARDAARFKDDIYFLTGKDDLFIERTYAAATVLLFPSLHEGFGWPLIEAMASFCPVITTDAAPMNEIGADCVVYIPPRPAEESAYEEWLRQAAGILESFLYSSDEEKHELTKRGKINLKRFDAEKALDKMEAIYKQILNKQ